MIVLHKGESIAAGSFLLSKKAHVNPHLTQNAVTSGFRTESHVCCFLLFFSLHICGSLLLLRTQVWNKKDIKSGYRLDTAECKLLWRQRKWKSYLWCLESGNPLKGQDTQPASWNPLDEKDPVFPSLLQWVKRQTLFQRRFRTVWQVFWQGINGCK